MQETTFTFNGAGSPEMQAGIAAGVILFVLAIFAVILIVKIFYLLMVQRAIGRCTPVNQAMSPGLVWLSMIPVFCLVWDFFIVINVAKSLGAEFRSRGMAEPEAPGKTLGLVMCILTCCAGIPGIGGFIGLGAFVCWIIYWVQIAGFSAKIEAPASEAIAA